VEIWFKTFKQKNSAKVNQLAKNLFPMEYERNTSNHNDRKKDNRNKNISRSRSRSRSHTPTQRRRATEKASDKNNRLTYKSSSLKDSDRFASENSKEKFVWGKKIEELQKKGMSQEDLENLEKEKQERLAREIEKVRRNKQAREKDQKITDRVKVNKEQEMDEEAYKLWLAKEEKFHIEQAKLRL